MRCPKCESLDRSTRQGEQKLEVSASGPLGVTAATHPSRWYEDPNPKFAN